MTESFTDSDIIAGTYPLWRVLSKEFDAAAAFALLFHAADEERVQAGKPALQHSFDGPLRDAWNAWIEAHNEDVVLRRGLIVGVREFMAPKEDLRTPDQDESST